MFGLVCFRRKIHSASLPIWHGDGELMVWQVGPDSLRKKPIRRAFRRRRRDGYGSILVDGRHLGNFPVFVDPAVLDDAQRINPKIAKTKLASDEDGVLYGLLETLEPNVTHQVLKSISP